MGELGEGFGGVWVGGGGRGWGDGVLPERRGGEAQRTSGSELG